MLALLKKVFCAILAPVKLTIYTHKKEISVAKQKQLNDTLPTPMTDEIQRGSFGAFGIDNSMSDLILVFLKLF